MHEVTLRGAAALAHDAKGNLTRSAGDTVDRYRWDYDNKLTSADTDQDGVADAAYTYDALGRRVSKTTGGGTTVVVCSLQQEVQEYPAGSLTPTRSYVYGTYVDEVLVKVEAGGAKHYYHQDSNYRIAALTDSTGAGPRMSINQPSTADRSGVA